MATKRIKMLKPWQFMTAGSIQEFPAPIAAELIRTGRAKEAEEVQTPAPAPKKKLKKSRRFKGK